MLVSLILASAVFALATATSVALPSGLFKGVIRIVPYTYSPPQYSCLTQCSYVEAPATLNWIGNALYINISAARNPQGCSLNAQTYYVSSVQVHQRYPYYGGSLSAQSQVIPVCFAFDNSGLFTITLDGAGTCPQQTDPPVCRQAGSAVIQTWAGSFVFFPSGRWTGYLNIRPYQQTGSGYQCLTQCGAIAAPSTLTFQGTTLSIFITRTTGPSGCSLNQQTYVIQNVQFHTTGYYGGLYNNLGQQFFVCMYFPGTGPFIITLDGQGSCPPPTASASCTAGAGGSVIQVWAGTYSLGEEPARLQIE